MGFFRAIQLSVRKHVHRREIGRALKNYSHKTGKNPNRAERYSDSGSFRDQLNRLFELGNATETEALVEIAESVVGASVMNRFYKPADFLADILADLERHTFLGFDDMGEAPLEGCKDQVERDTKLRHTMEAWLSPVKVAAIEAVLGDYARHQGRDASYQDLQEFERTLARVFSFLDTSEVFYVQKILCEALASDNFSGAPVAMLLELISALNGDHIPDGCGTLRTRRHGQGFRLSTLVPQDRQSLLRAALHDWLSVVEEKP